MSTQSFPDASRFYEMQLHHNSKPAKVENEGKKDGTQVVINQDVKSSSRWFLWPVDSESTSARDWHYLFNYNSGTAATIRDGSSKSGKDLLIDDFQAADYQQFKFTDTGKGYYVTVRHSDLNLKTHDEGGSDGTPVEQGGEQDESHHKWDFVEAVKIEIPTLQPGSDTDVATLLPRLTLLTETPPDESESVLVGEALTPFFMVDDPNRSLQEQIQQNPYYVLRREQLWTLADKVYTDGGVAYNKEVTETFGYNNSTTHSISNTIGVSVTADLGFSYGAVSASVSATYTRQLQVNDSSTHSESHLYQETETHSFPAGTEMNWALYQVIDRYTLLDGAGRSIYTWDVLCENTAQSSCSRQAGTDELVSTVEIE